MKIWQLKWNSKARKDFVLYLSIFAITVLLQNEESISTHYENKTYPWNIQFFSPVKIEKFHEKIFDIFLIFAQNIYCGYTLEPPR